MNNFHALKRLLSAGIEQSKCEDCENSFNANRWIPWLSSGHLIALRLPMEMCISFENIAEKMRSFQ